MKKFTVLVLGVFLAVSVVAFSGCAKSKPAPKAATAPVAAAVKAPAVNKVTTKKAAAVKAPAVNKVKS
ncbi:MAG TPA: hypothetical protein ENI54_01145 [bacterium]|nr:hypothetical protein [bacterium]